MKPRTALVAVFLCLLGCEGSTSSGVPETVSTPVDLLHPEDRAYVYRHLKSFEYQTYVRTGEDCEGTLVLESDWWGRTLPNRAGGLVHEARHSEMCHQGCRQAQEIDANIRAAEALDRAGLHDEATNWRNQGGVHCGE